MEEATGLHLSGKGRMPPGSEAGQQWSQVSAVGIQGILYSPQCGMSP